jgi:AcrR family transcriptional regulator
MKTDARRGDGAAPGRGRPRSFDREQALERAMLVFWEHGYEATSIQALTRAMGINPPSLYATFGDKEQLFLAVVERYRSGPGARAGGILTEAATAREAMARLLENAALELTSKAHPRGCLVITAAVSCSGDGARVQRVLGGHRAETEMALAARIARGIAEGELAADCDAAELAAFYMTVIEGMSLQARDGAGRARLLAVAQAAMRAWPAPAPRRPRRR